MTAKDGEDMQAFMNALSPGYFETMKIPIARRPRLPDERCRQGVDGGDRQSPLRRAFLSRQERRGEAHRVWRRSEAPN